MVLFPIKTFADFRCYDPFHFLLNLFPLPPVSSKACHSLSLSPVVFWVCPENPLAQILNGIKFQYWMLFICTDFDVKLIRYEDFMPVDTFHLCDGSDKGLWKS